MTLGWEKIGSWFRRSQGFQSCIPTCIVHHHGLPPQLLSDLEIHISLCLSLEWPARQCLQPWPLQTFFWTTQHLVCLLLGIPLCVLSLRVHLLLIVAELAQIIDVARDAVTDVGVAFEAIDRLAGIIESKSTAEAVRGLADNDGDLLQLFQRDVVQLTQADLRSTDRWY